MKALLTLDVEIDPELATTILADRFPVEKLNEVLNSGEVKFAEHSNFCLVQLESELGKHLVTQAIENRKALTGAISV